MISVNINEKLRLTYFKFQANVNSLDIANAIYHCTENPKWENGFDCFIDTRRQTSFIPLSEFYAIKKTVSAYKVNKNAKHAHLARNIFEFGMGKIWETFIGRHLINYKPFISEASAHNWLGRDVDEFTSFLSSDFLFSI